jgi:hypothetical protein
MEICEVQTELVPKVWSALAPQIDKALSTGQGDECTPESICAGIGSGLSQMWAIHDGDKLKGCVVVAVEQSAAARKVWVDLMAGEDVHAWEDKLEEVLDGFCRAVGATCVETSARPGLAKLLRNRGWKQKAVIMEYRVNE